MGDIDNLLQEMKEIWPKLVISKENILRPTQEVVCRFYSNFMHDCNEKIAYLTGVSMSFDSTIAHYEPEEQLFVQLSRFMEKINGFKFTLADIYQPISIRTKNFFKLCTHFMTYTETLQNVTDVLGNTVFSTKEDTAKLLLEQQALIDENNENAKKKAELIETKSLLEHELQSTRNSYKEMKALKAAKVKIYAEKRKQIENLKYELQNEEYNLKRLETVEKDLLEQRITEREHHNILHTIETLKSECEMLDSYEIDIGDGLVHENKVLQHSADCIRILNQCSFNVDNLRKLIHKEDELKATSNSLEKLLITKSNLIKQKSVGNEQKLMALKEQFSNLQSEYKILKETYSDNVNKFSQELDRLKDSLEDKSNNYTKIILEYKEEIEELEQNLNKMRNAFTTEYVRVSQVEKVVVDRFKEMLLKFKEM